MVRTLVTVALRSAVPKSTELRALVKSLVPRATPICGAEVMVMRKVFVAELLCASVAMTVTVLVPMGKRLPLAGLAVALTTPSTRSFALTEKVTVAPDTLVAGVVMEAGTVMTGGVVSTTRTVKVLVTLAPAESVALAVTMESPRGKVLPLAGETSGVSEPSSASLAVTVKDTTAPFGPVASAITGESGSVRLGAVLAEPWRVRVNVPLAASLFEMARVADLIPLLVGLKTTLRVVLDPGATPLVPGVPTLNWEASVPVRTAVSKRRSAVPRLVTVRTLVTVVLRSAVPKSTELRALVKALGPRATPICGAEVMVMRKVFVAELLCASVAMTVTVLVPMGKRLPLAGLAVALTTPST